MDVDTGTMLFGQNSHVEYYPASITKILTALVVLSMRTLPIRLLTRQSDELRGGGQRK